MLTLSFRITLFRIKFKLMALSTGVSTESDEKVYDKETVMGRSSRHIVLRRSIILVYIYQTHLSKVTG